MDIGCVVMASGLGERFSPGYKLMAPLAGKPLVAHLLSALPRDGFCAVVVVTRNEEVADLARNMGYETILHAQPYQSDTVKLGLLALGAVDGCLFCVADQPLCGKQSLEKILAAFQAQPDTVVRLGFEGVLGNPILFPRHLFPALLALEGDQGGGQVARRGPVRCVEARGSYELKDVDTRADLQALEQCRW